MMQNGMSFARPALAAALALGLCGCAAFRASVRDADADRSKPLEADFDYADLRSLGSAVAEGVLASELVAGAAKKPIFVVMGIQNRSRQHIETKALSDIIRTPLIQSGKVDFVNESRREELLREQGYQLANCPPDARVHIGRQLGARYMLTGTLVEDRRRAPPQVRVSQQEDVYFLLTVEITDLETGLIAWTTQRERLRRASRPMVGW